MLEITRLEAEELVFTYNVIEQVSYPLEKAVWSYFVLDNDQILIARYNFETKEKSYFLNEDTNMNFRMKTIPKKRRRRSRNSIIPAASVDYSMA